MMCNERWLGLGAQELFCCQGLRKLTLSDNDIATLPPAIAALVNLEFLDLSKNCMPGDATIYTNFASSAANHFVLNTDVWLSSFDSSFRSIIRSFSRARLICGVGLTYSTGFACAPSV